MAASLEPAVPFCHIRGMVTHRIVQRDGAYRIETIAPGGRHWLLRAVYATKKAASVRLVRLKAMAQADMPERGTPEHQPQDGDA